MRGAGQVARLLLDVAAGPVAPCPESSGAE